MKCIKYSGSGVISTMVDGHLVKIFNGDNHMEDKIAQGVMKNFKKTRIEDLCELCDSDSDQPTATQVVPKTTKKKAVAKKATKKKTTKKKATKKKASKKKTSKKKA